MQEMHTISICVLYVMLGPELYSMNQLSRSYQNIWYV